MEERGDIINYTSPEKVYKNHPDWLIKRLEWFQDLKFGFFSHWGMYNQLGIHESWPLSPEDTWARDIPMYTKHFEGHFEEFVKYYRTQNRNFLPYLFDPEEHADIIARSGARYVTQTSKHHDGFCIFDTRTTRYKVSDPSCPYSISENANILKRSFDALRKKGLAISCYFSKSDWDSVYYWNPNFPIRDRNVNYDVKKYPELWETFVKFTHAQIKELMTEYGEIDILWLDGGQVNPENNQDIRMHEIASFARELQPGLIIADRTVGGEYENFITPELQYPDAPLGVPWESCTPLGDAWGASAYEGGFRTVEESLKLLVQVVAMGGNLLMGFGPDKWGKMDKEGVKILEGIGKWLKLNGEGIFETRSVEPYNYEEIYFTQKAGNMYMFIIRKEEYKKQYTIPIDKIGRVKKIKRLSDGRELTFSIAGENITMEFLQEFHDNDGVSAFKILR